MSYYQNHRYADVCECIYCGNVESLSDEHIIPFGLNGTLILPFSSCNKCSAITSKFERSVLKGFMQDARKVAGLKTRRKKNQSKNILVRIKDRNNVVITKEILVSKGISVLHLPVLDPPRQITNRIAKGDASVRAFESLFVGERLENFLAEQSANEVQGSVMIDLFSFENVGKNCLRVSGCPRRVIPETRVPSIAICNWAIK